MLLEAAFNLCYGHYSKETGICFYLKLIFSSAIGYTQGGGTEEKFGLTLLHRGEDCVRMKVFREE